jgi:hypothetical protein
LKYCLMSLLSGYLVLAGESRNESIVAVFNSALAFLC